MEPAGQDPRAHKEPRTDQSTALFEEECQSFLDNLIAGLGQLSSCKQLIIQRPAGNLPRLKIFLGSFWELHAPGALSLLEATHAGKPTLPELFTADARHLHAT
jgi:hypothetical protein